MKGEKQLSRSALQSDIRTVLDKDKDKFFDNDSPFNGINMQRHMGKTVRTAHLTYQPGIEFISIILKSSQNHYRRIQIHSFLLELQRFRSAGTARSLRGSNIGFAQKIKT